MAIRKYASLENVQVLDLKGSKTKVRHASLGKLADFENYRTSDGYLYARIRAISSRVNKNHDGWPSIELAGDQAAFDRHLGAVGITITADSNREYGFSTFLGKPIFVDHHNSNPDRARGVIVDGKFHIDDHKTSSLDPYYSSPDVDPEHLPGSWVELLLEIDAKGFPKFAKAVVEGSRNPRKGIDGWSMGCFVPGTPITLANGTQKPIETITVGDQVLTHTGRIEDVTYVMEKPHDGLIYDLTTYGQSVPLRLTEEHPIWVKRTADTIRGKARSQGGTCICGRSFATNGSFGAHLREVKRRDLPGEHSRDSSETISWVEAKDVRVGDYVLTPMPDGVGHPGSYPFARLLGYYAAEGNVGYDRKRFADGRPVFVEWTFAEDEIEYLEEVTLMLESLGYKAAGPYLKNGAATIRCNSSELAQRFVDFGGKYSWGKRLHPEVLRWMPENQKALVDAYFNGDAHQTDTRIEAGTASRDLAQQLQLLAMRAGYRMTPPIEQYSPSAQRVGSKPKWSMQTTLTQPKSKARAHMSSTGMWRRIETIALKHYEGPVYNFDVEGDDSYVAADVAVHNCDVEKSVCSICKNSAASPEDYCDHIRMKGAYFDYIDPKGHKTSRRAYENCYGIKFFEISGVFDPADETALSREVRSKTQEETITQDPSEGTYLEEVEKKNEEWIDQSHEEKERRKKEDKGTKKKSMLPGTALECPNCAGDPGLDCPMCHGRGYMTADRPGGDGAMYPFPHIDPFDVPQKLHAAPPFTDVAQLGPVHQGMVKKADNPLPQAEMSHSPEKVDTLREEETCPVCGSSMDEDTCDVCFTPDTLVRTKDGYVPIATISPGDRVLSSDGAFHRVSEVLERDYHGFLVQMRTRSMPEPVQVTGNHPFLAMVGNHVSKTTPCSPARCERTIQHPRSKTHHRLDWVAADHLHDKSYLATNVPTITYDLEYITIPEAHQGPQGDYRRHGPSQFELTPDFLWMIGLYLAEGSPGTRSINFALHRNEITEQQRLIDLFTTLGYTAKLIIRPGRPNSAWVEVYSSTLAEWFPAWLGAGSHNKRIPGTLLNLPLSKLEYIWQGILDGDGHNARRQFGQTSPLLALQMTEIAIRRNGEPTLQIMRPAEKKVVYQINGTTITQTRHPKGHVKRGTWHFADRYLSQVRELTEVPYCGRVFNLRVEDDPTYTVQGILVHNCGYQQPPDGFNNPDLTKVQDVDVPEPEKGPEMAPEPTQLNTEPPQPTNTPNNPTSLAHVTSDMGWEVHEKTSARINKVEQSTVATDKPATNEPNEKILSDQLKPVTSNAANTTNTTSTYLVRTAEDFIAAAGAKGNQMNHTADAASGAPAVAKPKVNTDVVGVGGVDEASNEAASKADAQVETTAIGGTGVESVSAEQEGTNLEQGTEHSKNIEAIPTKTWSDGQGDSLGQHAPVTSEPFPAHEDGVRASNWHVESYDDAAFPGDEIAGGSAVRGVQPIAESFGERVDVLDHVTSPANNSGPTTTWTGTDGNGVLKQQDPVTNDSIARGESGMEGAPNWTSSTQVFAAFKLADLEVDLGLLPSDRKYERAAELEQESPAVLAATLKYAQRIKRTAKKTAGVQKLPVMGRPTVIEKETSVDTTEDDSFMFGA